MGLADKRTSALIDLALTVVFYVMAISSVLAYFRCREESPRLFIILGAIAIGVRILHYVKKFFFTPN